MDRITCALWMLLAIASGCAGARAELTPASTSDEILDALHARGASLNTLAANVKLISIDTDLGGEDSRTGRIVLEQKPGGDTRILVTFTQRQVGKRIEKERRDYLLDGPNLIDRDWAGKKEVIRIVRRPGEKMNLLKLGEGPFPLPIGQPRESVLNEFEVKKVDSKDKVQIELAPKPASSIARKFKTITITVNPEGWPVEVATIDPKELDIRKAQLSDIRTNEAVKPDEFKLEPLDDTWSKVEEAYPG